MSLLRWSQVTKSGRERAKRGGFHRDYMSTVVGIRLRLPAPLRVLCRLTRGNRQPCHPGGGRGSYCPPGWLGGKGCGTGRGEAVVEAEEEAARMGRLVGDLLERVLAQMADEDTSDSTCLGTQNIPRKEA